MLPCHAHRSGFRSPFSAETALQALIAGNAAVFIGWRLDPYFMHKHFTVSLRAVREGRVYTMLTACFSHNDFWHLAVNMLTLYFFWDRW
jgi:membrane associated rhomboid family serine protease